MRQESLGRGPAPTLFGLERQGLIKFASIALQLALLVLVSYFFRLENLAFQHFIMPLALGGFVVHYFLPLRLRLPFFLSLSLLGILLIFGLGDGAWLIGLGLALVGLCHLPVAFGLRVVILLGAGAALAALRGGVFEGLPWTSAIWPILGSIFMFRLIVYMYSLRHQKEATEPWRALSYFFLLPNPVFPLFPVVDYNTFRRTYYNEERHLIYQRGVTTIFWGSVHLIAYRFVNYYLTLAPSDVESLSTLTRYMITNFLLYLRVSGQFHIIVGILHLFGFNLPLTHHLYYLASSFTDFWRRINIYWKDFMQTVFYYPAYFRLRKLGNLTAMLVATGLVFFMTWFLHAYQWFWLRGSFLLAWHDVLFWVILSVFVMVNIVLEVKRGRKRSLTKTALSGGELVRLSAQRVVTFLTICVLWSFWSSNSVGAWTAMVGAAGADLSAADLGSTFVILAGVAAIITAATFAYDRWDKPASERAEPPNFARAAAVTAVMTAALAFVGSGLLDRPLNDQTYALVQDLKRSRLGNQDARLLEQGYYEDLVGVNRFNSELWQLYNRRPADWLELHQTDAALLTDDLLKIQIRPSVDMTYKGAAFSTNQWGMRDQDYPEVAPEDAYRVALLGASRVMGAGVADNETFEARLEERLNRDGEGYSDYQVLNFGVAGYNPLQSLTAYETKALAFDPNAVFYIAKAGEADETATYLAERIRAQATIPYPFLEDVARQAGVDENTSSVIAERRLQPFGSDIVAWAYREIVASAEARGMSALWIYLPTLDSSGKAAEAAAALQTLARDAGFEIIDLSDVFAGADKASLALADWDKHPNAQGHNLIAEKLYAALMESNLAETLAGRAP